MTAPIVLFVYNRPQHTQRTLQALAAAEDADKSQLFVFSDAAKTAEDQQAVSRVREICACANGFKEVHIVEREQNIGLAANIIDGVTEIINRYGRVIVLEDDLIVSHYFLKYMNSALDFYENRGIFSISGYTPEIKIPTNYTSSTYAMLRNGSWGWATWKLKWNKVDWSVATFPQFIRSARMRRAFNQCGNDLTPMLLKQQKGVIQSWSIRFCFAAFLAGEPTIFPTQSLVQNIGVDGSGTHMRASSKYTTTLAPSIDISAFLPTAVPDKRIAKSFKKFYNTSIIRTIINRIKLIIYLLFK